MKPNKQRPARVLVDRSDSLHYFDDIAFQGHFCKYKENALEIISFLKPRLSSLSLRGRSLPSSLQVLLTLRFLVSETFHRETGDLCGASEATVCRIVCKFCRAICELRSLYIIFPDAADQDNYKVQFYEYGHFPGVIGCIDGCHVPIKCSSTPDAEEYRNRKKWFSINIQGVCTSNLEFANIVACWKGSTHDSRIFLFQRGQQSRLLLGDSGYGQSKFLFTPYINPTITEQQRYNRAHIQTRDMVECMFGIWKNQFQCLRNTQLAFTLHLDEMHFKMEHDSLWLILL
uniref:DDE Tnp4 domain-containing protein n=1 Tax=Cyprinus carpio carpio TaxID=630221 RepID=A0A9J7XNM0_CYPCA